MAPKLDARRKACRRAKSLLRRLLNEQPPNDAPGPERCAWALAVHSARDLVEYFGGK